MHSRDPYVNLMYLRRGRRASCLDLVRDLVSGFCKHHRGQLLGISPDLRLLRRLGLGLRGCRLLAGLLHER